MISCLWLVGYRNRLQYCGDEYEFLVPEYGNGCVFIAGSLQTLMKFQLIKTEWILVLPFAWCIPADDFR